jgi:murein L,D-transpeptidase YafK
MQVDYPNAADRRRPRAEGVTRLGGDIFVHGGCATIGCVPLGDAAIGRLYVLAADVRAGGGRLDAHLFPTAHDDAHAGARADAAGDDAALRRFWDEELAPGWAWFERERTLPPIEVDAAGRYVLRGRRSR